MSAANDENKTRRQDIEILLFFCWQGGLARITARPIRHNAQVPDRNGKIFFTLLLLLYRTSVKSQGMKQLMAGGGVALIGITLVPQLAGLFG